MKTLLVNLPNNLSEILGDGQQFVTADVPYGLFSIKAYLSSKNLDCSVLDAFVENIDLESCFDRIKASDADIIGLSVLTSTGALAYHLGRKIRQELPHKRVVMGNLHASHFADFYLENGCADIIVHAEGEETLYEIIKALEEGEDLARIKGISYLNPSRTICRTDARPFIRNLSALPLANKAVDLKRYSALNSKPPYVKLITSRGCVNKCKFCAVHNGRRYRSCSADRMIEEISYLVKTYNVTSFNFEESLFTADKKRVYRFCDLLKKKGLKIEWKCEGHINCVDEQLLKKMHQAGCSTISYGIESGNQHILNSIGKRTKLDQISEIVTLSRNTGLEVHGLFILGLPGETQETIRDTISFARKLPLNAAQFAIFTPYPGTEYYQTLKSAGKLIENLDDIDFTLSNWLRYTQYPVFGEKIRPIYTPDGISYDQLVKYQQIALRKFYFRFRTLFTKQSRFRINGLSDLWSYFQSGLKLVGIKA